MAKGFKSGGRKPGVRNKTNQAVEEIASRFKLDPFEVLLMVVNGDWKGLGYEAETRTSFAASGIEFEEPAIKLSDRVAAAKEASKYLYSQKQSVALSAGDTGLIIKVVDYTKKELG